MKRGQIPSQVFVYILAIIIVAMILLLGYKGVNSIQKRGDQVALIQFETDLKNDIELIKGDRGSVIVEKYKTWSGFDEICFVDLQNVDPSDIIDYPIIKDSVESGVNANAFLYGNNLETIYIEDLELSNYPYFYCFQPKVGAVELRIKGKGSAAVIVIPSEQIKLEVTCDDCGDWELGDCGAGSCTDRQRLETRTNCPSDLSCEAAKCVEDATCGGPPSDLKFNPPYPRVGQLTFYNPGLAGPDIWKNHEMVAIRHYKGSDAMRIKEKNPDVLLLAANDAMEGVPIEIATGQSLPEEWYLHDSSGNRILIWGGYKTDMSNPNFRSYLAGFLNDNTNWNYFDASIFDSWWEVSNEVENSFANEMRDITNHPVIPQESSDNQFFNGNAFEFWTPDNDLTIIERAGVYGWNVDNALRMQRENPKPIVNYANSEVGLKNTYHEGDYVGPVFRADFTSSQIAGAFFGHDEGTFAHRWTFMHDEYEADLGYPTGDAQKLDPEGVWIRYFDNGVLISNIAGKSKTACPNQLSGGPFYRFKGNQNPDFYDGSEFDSCINFDTFDGIMLMKYPNTVLVTPIIIDNVDKNMNSILQNPVDYSSGWNQVTGVDGSEHAYYLKHGWGEYSEPYAISTVSGAKATYRPKFGLSGRFEVFEWHPSISIDNQGSGCTNVELKINHASGTATKTVNQIIAYGQWNSLGTYNFNKGISGSVVLTAPGGCTAASDAIKFVYKE